jgi:hypothetical protein
MSYPDSFSAALKLSCTQLAITWLKDANKTDAEKNWAKTQLVNLNGQLDEYLTITLQGQGVTKDTPFADFKAAVELALPDAYLASTVVYTAPSSEPVVDLPYITRLAFRNRFTQQEKAAIYTAAQSNVSLQVFMDDLNAATYIDVERPDTIQAINTLETAGLLAAGRAAEILSTTILPIERYKGVV